MANLNKIFKINTIVFYFFFLSLVGFAHASLFAQSNNFENNIQREYSELEDLIDDFTLKSGCIVKTLGYYKKYDNGGATYRIIEDNDTFDSKKEFGVKLRNGLVAKMIIADDFVNVKQFGAKGDGLNDDSKSAQQAILCAKNVEFPEGNYLLHNIVLYDNRKLMFDNEAYVKLSYYSSIKNAFKNVFCLKNIKNIDIVGLKIIGDYSTVLPKKKDPTKESIIDCVSCDSINILNAKISKLYFKNTKPQKNIMLRKGAIGNFINCTNVVIKDCEFLDVNHAEWFDGYEVDGGHNTLTFDNCIFGKNSRGCSATSVQCSKLVFVNNKIVDYKYSGSLLNLLSEEVYVENNYIDNSNIAGDDYEFNCVFDVTESGMFASRKVVIKNNSFVGRSQVFVKCMPDDINIINNNVNHVNRMIVYVSRSANTKNNIAFEKNTICIANNNIFGGMSEFPQKKMPFLSIGYKANDNLNKVEILNNKFNLTAYENDFININNARNINISGNILPLSRIWSKDPNNINYGCVSVIISDSKLSLNDFIVERNEFVLPKPIRNGAKTISYCVFHNNSIVNNKKSNMIPKTNFMNNIIECNKNIKSDLSYFDKRLNSIRYK